MQERLLSPSISFLRATRDNAKPQSQLSDSLIAMYRAYDIETRMKPLLTTSQVRDRLESILSSDRNIIMAAQDGRTGDVIGFGALQENTNDPAVAEFVFGYVDPIFRGKGVYTSIVRQVIKEAKLLGYSRLLAYPINTYAAQKGLLNAGFTPVETQIGEDNPDLRYDLNT